MLREALVAAGVSFVEAPGEAAFYGPKIDVQVVDALAGSGASPPCRWTSISQRQFDLSYVDHDAERRRPVMVHRSLVGSLERLFAHLIEVHQGAFPAWYAPVQVLVATCRRGAGRRGATDSPAPASPPDCERRPAGDGSLGARIREARLVPYLAVIGGARGGRRPWSLRLRSGQNSRQAPSARRCAICSPNARCPVSTRSRGMHSFVCADHVLRHMISHICPIPRHDHRITGGGRSDDLRRWWRRRRRSPPTSALRPVMTPALCAR